MSFVTEELAFQSDNLCREFLSQFGVVYADDERTKIDCKTSSAAVTSAWKTMWTLYGQLSNYSVLKTFSDQVTNFFNVGALNSSVWLDLTCLSNLLVAFTFLPYFPNFSYLIPIVWILSSQWLLPVRLIEKIPIVREEFVALQIRFQKVYYLDHWKILGSLGNIGITLK